jgi:type IV pilus assembly protein PilO
MTFLLEMFFKINKIQRTLIVAAIAVLLLVAFYFLVIYDLQDQIAQLEESIGKIKLEIINQERNLAEGPKLKTRIEELRKRLQTMVASLPEKQDIEQLLKKITDLLSESNLIAKRFVPGQEQINEELFYATIPIQLNVRGDYQKQGAFLASLNTLPRIVNVPTIRMVKATGLSAREMDLARKLDAIPLDGDISGVTYRRLSQDEIKAIAQKKKAAPPPKRRR